MLSSAVALLFQVLAQAQGPPSGAAGPPEGAEGNPGGQSISMFIMFGAIFFLMYLFVFRPQSKREAEEKSLLEKLKKDDHVVTKGGLFGVVVGVKDDEVTLRIDENNGTRVRYQKSAIAAILSDDDKKKGDGKSS